MLIRSLLALLLAGGALLASACAKDSTDDTARGAAVEPAAVVTRIDDRSLVCMVNDAYMGKAQIPIVVYGKTYFGCCPMCKERLANEAETRSAIDPVNGERVDKATALLARDADGHVLYFGSEQNLRGYRGAL